VERKVKENISALITGSAGRVTILDKVKATAPESLCFPLTIYCRK